MWLIRCASARDASLARSASSAFLRSLQHGGALRRKGRGRQIIFEIDETDQLGLLEQRKAENGASKNGVHSAFGRMKGWFQKNF